MITPNQSFMNISVNSVVEFRISYIHFWPKLLELDVILVQPPG